MYLNRLEISPSRKFVSSIHGIFPLFSYQGDMQCKCEREGAKPEVVVLDLPNFRKFGSKMFWAS